MKTLYQPKFITFQWHITERCNWRCQHCYQENYNTPEMNLEEMKDVLKQYAALIKKWHLPKQCTSLQITGGEPFVRKDFFEFLEEVHKYSDTFNWAVMSNGSLLNEENIRKLKSLGIEGFQVSLEGLEKTNDEIREQESFQKVVRAIRLLDQEKIPVRVSLTLTKNNHKEIRELAIILASLNIRALGVRRIAPLGLNESQFKNLMLEPLELRTLYKELEEINKEMIRKDYFLRVVGGCENAVFNDEISDPNLMRYDYCAVVDGRTLTLMPDGDVLVCRRCPIKIGNVYKKSLEEIYYSPTYEALRNKKDVPWECCICSNLKSCYGGAKCVTHAVTGKTAPDIQCWKLFDNLNESAEYVKSPSMYKKIKLIAKYIKSTYVQP